MKKCRIEEYKNQNLYRVKYVSGMNATESVRQDYHRSTNLVFTFFIKGKAVVNIEGSSYQINEGDVIILNPSEFFLFNIDDNTFHERVTFLSNINMANSFPADCLNLFSAFYKRDKGVGNIIPFEIVKKHGVDKLFYQLLGFVRGDFQAKETLVMCKIAEILHELGKNIENTEYTREETVSVSPLVEGVLKYVDENYTKDIDIQSIADSFGVHRSYLSHEFNKKFGMSLWKYIILRRIYKFNSLMTSASSIEEVAYSVGFHNYSNFFRLYKKHMRMTPMEFKKQCNKSE